MEYKHTWRFDADSKLVRFWCWCWFATPDDLDFCKLFWGLLFSPLAVLFHPVATVAQKWERKRIRERRAREEELARWRVQNPDAALREMQEHQRKPKAKEEPPPVAREPSAMLLRLARIAEFFSKPLPRKVFRFIGIALMVLIGVGGVGAAVYLIVVNLAKVLTALVIAVGVIIALGVLFLLVKALDKRGFFGGVSRRAKSGGRSFKRKALTTGHFIRDAARAVKTNTCPKIEVDEKGVR